MAKMLNSQLVKERYRVIAKECARLFCVPTVALAQCRWSSSLHSASARASLDGPESISSLLSQMAYARSYARNPS